MAIVKEEIRLTMAIVFLRYICIAIATATMNHELSAMTQSSKHEIIACERCGSSIECKANSFTKCQCSVIQLNLNEVQYISENYEGCMCAACLLALQQEYREMIGIV